MQQLPCVPSFSACGFSPLIQNHVCRSTVVLISLLCCLWFQETLFALPKAPAEFMGKWATPTWAWALHPWRSFSPAKAHGHCSREQAKGPRTQRRRRRVGKNVPRQDGGQVDVLLGRSLQPDSAGARNRVGHRTRRGRRDRRPPPLSAFPPGTTVLWDV